MRSGSRASSFPSASLTACSDLPLRLAAWRHGHEAGQVVVWLVVEQQQEVGGTSAAHEPAHIHDLVYVFPLPPGLVLGERDRLGALRHKQLRHCEGCTVRLRRRAALWIGRAADGCPSPVPCWCRCGARIAAYPPSVGHHLDCVEMGVPLGCLREMAGSATAGSFPKSRRVSSSSTLIHVDPCCTASLHQLQNCSPPPRPVTARLLDAVHRRPLRARPSCRPPAAPVSLLLYCSRERGSPGEPRRLSQHCGPRCARFGGAAAPAQPDAASDRARRSMDGDARGERVTEPPSTSASYDGLSFVSVGNRARACASRVYTPSRACSARTAQEGASSRARAAGAAGFLQAWSTRPRFFCST
jgi:hypothetical protein